MRLLSNNPIDKNYVIRTFQKLISKSSDAYLAAPYFTYADPLVEAVHSGTRIQLLVGLNSATDPGALTKVFGLPGVTIRYFTKLFHAKIFVFDDAAMVGSANLTDNGFKANREAVAVFDGYADRGAVEDVRALFAELWDDAQVLTPDKLRNFDRVWRATRSTAPSPDVEIEREVGPSSPQTIRVDSNRRSGDQLFLEGLRRKVYEQFRPAFIEVNDILVKAGLLRSDLAELDEFNQTNRFLNWLRLSQAPGDTIWRQAPLRSQVERRAFVESFGREWVTTRDSKVSPDYLSRLRTIRTNFSTPETVASLDRQAIVNGLEALHAFYEQLRFVRGGLPNLGSHFWEENDNDPKRVSRSLAHLLFGSGDFIERLHDLLYNRQWKLNYFGLFSALELFGSVRPELYPPINGRMAKALRFIGFDVPGN